MQKKENKNNVSVTGIIVLIGLLIFLLGDILVPLLTLLMFLFPVILLVFALTRSKKNAKKGPPRQPSFREPQASTAPRQPEPMKDFLADECPRPFCFHKDRGEHHLKKGKEADPWDRPDIDIRKYQHH